MALGLRRNGTRASPHVASVRPLPGQPDHRQRTPDLAKAARATIERRLANGGGHTGWSRAWIINFWTRLADRDKAYEYLLALFRNSTLPNLDRKSTRLNSSHL